MRTAGGVVIVVVAAVMGCALTSWPAVADPAAELAAELDRMIEERVAQLGVPGAIVGLSIPGEIEYVRAVGIGDTATGIPMLVDDHMRIGSVTKTFTGTAVLQLVDQGRISLSDTISRYVEGVPSGDVITLDLLGRMRSGLPNYTEPDTFVNRLYSEAPAGPDAFALNPRQLVDAAFEQPMNFAPGTDYEYSNTNTALLGLVVEKVTGQPLADYMRQNIFDPVGLTQTSLPGNGALAGPYAHGYNKGPDGTVYDATMVVMVNSDIPEPHSAGQIAYSVSSVATPNYRYELGQQPPLLIDDQN